MRLSLIKTLPTSSLCLLIADYKGMSDCLQNAVEECALSVINCTTYRDKCQSEIQDVYVCSYETVLTYGVVPQDPTFTQSVYTYSLHIGQHVIYCALITVAVQLSIT